MTGNPYRLHLIYRLDNATSLPVSSKQIPPLVTSAQAVAKIRSGFSPKDDQSMVSVQPVQTVTIEIDKRHYSSTYRSNILKPSPDVAHDVVDIFTILQESQSLGERDLTDNIKLVQSVIWAARTSLLPKTFETYGKVLQPDAPVANLACRYKSFIQLLEETLNSRINERFERDQIRHGVRARNWFLKHTMHTFILCPEEAWKHFSLGHGQDNMVEVGLQYIGPSQFVARTSYCCRDFGVE